jgi:hypothetical protein
MQIRNANKEKDHLALIHRWVVGVLLNSVVALWAGILGGVGVDDLPISVSGCSCGSFVSRDGWEALR